MIACLFINTIIFGELLEKQIEEKNQEEMLTFMQLTAKYRFGNDLKVGDKVTYKKLGVEGQHCSLEVIENNNQKLLIKEYFDNITYYILWDSKTKEICDFYGYDEEKKLHKPELLNEEKLADNLNEYRTHGFLDMLPKIIKSESITTFQTREKSIPCSKYELELSDDFKQEKSKEKIDQFLEKNSFYFSSEIPKMIPFTFVTLSFVNSLDLLTTDEGFVKNRSLELADYSK
jgi:hypothetical protein